MPDLPGRSNEQHGPNDEPVLREAVPPRVLVGGAAASTASQRMPSLPPQRHTSRRSGAAAGTAARAGRGLATDGVGADRGGAGAYGAAFTYGAFSFSSAPAREEADCGIQSVRAAMWFNMVPASSLLSIPSFDIVNNATGNNVSELSTVFAIQDEC